MKANLNNNSGGKSSFSSKISFKIDLQAYVLIIAFLLIVVIFGFFTGGEFLSSRNVSNLFTQMSVIALLAIGMTLVLILAQIDWLVVK